MNRGAPLVAAGIFLSRVAGLVRERAFAHYLGNSLAAGAFRAALRIPNFLQNLFGEGVLSASFIPVYSRLLGQGDEALAGRVAGVVASVLALGVSVLVLVGMAVTPQFVALVAPGFDGELRELTIRIVRVLFPGVGLLVMSAWCLGVLNSHRKFFLSYAAPVLWNFAMIGTLVFWGSRGLAAEELAVALAWGAVVGSALQLGSQLPFVWRDGKGIRPGLDFGLAPVREVFRNLGPVVVSRGVVQVSAYIDEVIASFLGAAALSGLGYAQTLYLLPVSLFGMSVAASELPEMARATGGEASEVHARLRTRLESGKRRIAFFVIPTVVGFLLVGRWIVAALFETGRFGASDTLYVWYVLMGSTVGLLAATWGRLYSSVFYALGDTRTPLKFALVRVTLTAGLGVVFAFPLRPWIALALSGAGLPAVGDEVTLGAVGLTASAGLAGWVEFWLLRRALQRRIGLVVVGRFVRLWAMALFAGAVSWAVMRFGGSELVAGLGALHGIAGAALAVGSFGVVYLGLARVMGR